MLLLFILRILSFLLHDTYNLVIISSSLTNSFIFKLAKINSFDTHTMKTTKGFNKFELFYLFCLKKNKILLKF